VKKKEVIVIGGGIIGVCIAEKLRTEGHSVTVIEQQKIAAGASYGNAAGFAFSEILPLASAGTIRKSIGWFFDPTGPFSVVIQDLPKTFKWLVHFLFSSRQATFQRSTKTLSALMKYERQTLQKMHDRTGLDSMMHNYGALYLYESEKNYQTDLKNWQLREKNNISYQSFEGQALHDFQPGLKPTIKAAVFVADYPTVSNPNDYCQAIHKQNEENGVKTLYQQVVDISANASSAEVSLKDGGVLKADKVVVATGAWSAKLAQKMGDNVPLVGERGYNTTLPDTALPSLERTLFFSEHGFVMTPLDGQVRVGGASEIATLERPPEYKRSKSMLMKAKSFLPNLDTNGGSEWMGCRPTLPDTLPVIGASKQSNNVLYAFGHGHLGLTLSSSTAQMISDLVAERECEIDINPLRVDRF